MNYTPLTSLPPVSRDPSDILRLFGPGSEGIQRKLRNALGPKWAKSYVAGLDLEFDGDTPTILGLSDGELNVSVPWHDGLPYLRQLLELYPNIVWVGHAIVSADLFVLRSAGIDLPLVNLQDTIIWHWLCNMSLCKGTKKTEDGDGDAKGRGYMNLGAFLSIYTSLPNHKICRGEECQSTDPCYDHNPYDYNGLDSYGPVVALPSVVMQARMRGVDKLYDLHRDLVYVLAEMSKYGIQTDPDYISMLQVELERNREQIAATLPFAPTSWQQAIKYFKGKGIHLPDTSEATIREYVEETGDEELQALLDYKELGKGAIAWFGPRFVDANHRVHPRLQIFTSSSRLACASPNFQNLPHWRIDRKTKENIGGKIRRGVIASPGTYLGKFDLKNGEGRVVFNFSGYDVPPDAHTWVAEMIGLTPDMEYCQREGGPRQGGKKISHSQAYLEGLQLRTPKELRNERIRKEISVGARVVYPDWTFEGKVVTFTGANFADRVWGSKSLENRKKALELIEGKYFKNLPGVREWHKRITRDCEKQGAIVTPLGYYTLSYGVADDRMKTCAAVHGSQPVGHLTKIALIRAWRAFEAGRPMRPLLQEHDSILYEIRDDVDPKQAIAWMNEDGVVAMPEIPGLTIPLDCGVSLPTNGEPSNWRDIH